MTKATTGLLCAALMMPTAATADDALVRGIVGLGTAIMLNEMSKTQPRTTTRRAAAPNPQQVAAARQRREVQRLLNEAGYGAGSVDGVYGRQTRAAIAQFQMSIGHLATGDITQDQIQILRHQRSQPQHYASPYAPQNYAAQPYAAPSFAMAAPSPAPSGSGFPAMAAPSASAGAAGSFPAFGAAPTPSGGAATGFPSLGAPPAPNGGSAAFPSMAAPPAPNGGAAFPSLTTQTAGTPPAPSAFPGLAPPPLAAAAKVPLNPLPSPMPADSAFPALTPPAPAEVAAAPMPVLAAAPVPPSALPDLAAAPTPISAPPLDPSSVRDFGSELAKLGFTPETQPSIIGIKLGQDFATAQEVLTQAGYASCEVVTEGRALECVKSSAAIEDMIFIEAAGDGKLWLVNRQLSFSKPTPMAGLAERFTPAYPQLMAKSGDFRLLSSGENCAGPDQQVAFHEMLEVANGLVAQETDRATAETWDYGQRCGVTFSILFEGTPQAVSTAHILLANGLAVDALRHDAPSSEATADQLDELKL